MSWPFLDQEKTERPTEPDEPTLDRSKPVTTAQLEEFLDDWDSWFIYTYIPRFEAQKARLKKTHLSLKSADDLIAELDKAAVLVAKKWTVVGGAVFAPTDQAAPTLDPNRSAPVDQNSTPATKEFWVLSIYPYPECRPFKYSNGTWSEPVTVLLDHDVMGHTELRLADKGQFPGLAVSSVVTITVEPFPGI